VKHLLVEQTHKGVTVKCGGTMPREDTTVWLSEVDCPKCRPYDWVPDPRGHGLMQVERTPPPKSKRRIVKTPPA